MMLCTVLLSLFSSPLLPKKLSRPVTNGYARGKRADYEQSSERLWTVEVAVTSGYLRFLLGCIVDHWPLSERLPEQAGDVLEELVQGIVGYELASRRDLGARLQDDVLEEGEELGRVHQPLGFRVQGL